jgi:DNA helicase-2/ATP-dependent DNA helicase PcrA
VACNFSLVKNLLEDLNDAQKKAVEYTEGPSMVIAGAGSGKTRVLTYRVAYLIHKGVDPFHILALTFTNKAAREMKERITILVGPEARNVWMGTFHAIFARVLRIEGMRLGYTPNYTIYDTEDSKRLLKNIIKEMELDNKVYTPGYVLHRISIAKTSLISAKQYNADPELMAADKMSGKSRTGEIYTLYQQRLKKADAMDFDDLLFNTNILLDNFPEVLIKYQRKFKYILVDEYQDTNRSQYLIIKRLAANDENICVVGDDAQSIYAFRGANIQNILNFKHDYPDHKIFKLEQNYRSTKVIVDAANSIIVNNKDQIFKKIWTENEQGLRIRVIRATSDTEEGILVVNSIFENKMNNQLGNNAFAILYRTNAQSRAFEEALRKLGIPYRIYGGLSFYQRKEIKDLLAYFRLAINNHDEEALHRVINYPARGIGQTTLEKLIVTAAEINKSQWDVIEDSARNRLVVNSGTRLKLVDFTNMIKSFTVQLKTRSAFDLASIIARTSGIMKDLFDDQSPEGVSRTENIEELLNAIKEFTESPREINDATAETGLPPFRTLGEFMQDVALLTDADDKDKQDRNHVSLMTVHSAKGLEFPYVYVVGMEENLFPSVQSLNDRADLEEERRLFYVAVTRGMKSVTLSYAENRYRWGDLLITEPSRFIEEIDPSFLEMPKKASIFGAGHSFFDRMSPRQVPNQEPPTLKGKKLKKINPTEESSGNGPEQSDDLDGLQVGMEVHHKVFGKGKVISVEGAGGNRKALIFFQNVGQKQLLLKFARLKIL